jgi:signal transduction histidine kinase
VHTSADTAGDLPEPTDARRRGAAHDLRNLLTVILGYTELVLQDVGPGHRSAADLEKVLRSADTARDLVDELLAPSPAGQGSNR